MHSPQGCAHESADDTAATFTVHATTAPAAALTVIVAGTAAAVAGLVATDTITVTETAASPGSATSDADADGGVTRLRVEVHGAAPTAKDTQ